MPLQQAQKLRSAVPARRTLSPREAGTSRQLRAMERASQATQNVVPLRHSLDRADVRQTGAQRAAANDDQWQRSQARQAQSDTYRQEMLRKEALVASQARTVGEQDAGKQKKRGIATVLAMDAGRKTSIIRSAAALAISHRKKIKEGDFLVFFLAFVLALSKDGLLDLIPIVWAIPGLFITVYLFIFLWGRGTRKWKLIRSVLLIMDLVPIIGMIPFSTFCVWIAYRHAVRDATNSQETLRNMDRKVSGEVSKPTPLPYKSFAS